MRRIAARRSRKDPARALAVTGFACAGGSLFLLIADLGETVGWARLSIEVAALAAGIALIALSRR